MWGLSPPRAPIVGTGTGMRLEEAEGVSRAGTTVAGCQVPETKRLWTQPCIGDVFAQDRCVPHGPLL